MNLTANEAYAIDTAKMLIPRCQDMVWRAFNDSCLMTTFVGRTTESPSIEAKLTATMHGGHMTLWLDVDRLTLFGLRRTLVGSVLSTVWDDEYDILQSLFNGITSSPKTIGMR